jgi:hypothetical protein
LDSSSRCEAGETEVNEEGSFNRSMDPTASGGSIDLQAAVEQLMGNEEQAWYTETFTKELEDLQARNEQASVGLGDRAETDEHKVRTSTGSPVRFISLLEVHACDARSPVRSEREGGRQESARESAEDHDEPEELPCSDKMKPTDTNNPVDTNLLIRLQGTELIKTVDTKRDLEVNFVAVCASTKRDLSCSFASYDGEEGSCWEMEGMQNVCTGSEVLALRAASNTSMQAAEEAIALALAAAVLAEVDAATTQANEMCASPVSIVSRTSVHKQSPLPLAESKQNIGTVGEQPIGKSTAGAISRATLSESSIGQISRLVSTPLGTTQIGETTNPIEKTTAKAIMLEDRENVRLSPAKQWLQARVKAMDERTMEIEEQTREMEQRTRATEEQLKLAAIHADMGGRHAEGQAQALAIGKKAGEGEQPRSAERTEKRGCEAPDMERLMESYHRIKERARATQTMEMRI